MRNVVLWVGMSLDGFTSAENERLDWLVPHATQPEAHEVFQHLRKRADTILLGRVNYEGFLGSWPPVKNDPKASANDRAISRWLDDTDKVVFLRTLREVTWKNARLARRAAAGEVAVGRGRALFAGLSRQIELECSELKPVKDGTLVVRYKVKHDAAAGHRDAA